MTSLARNAASNAASVSTFSAFFFLETKVTQIRSQFVSFEGLKVVRSVVRSLAWNVARNVARHGRPTAVLQYTLRPTLISLRKREVSSYVTLHDTE